jgi:hypothetical protein
VKLHTDPPRPSVQRDAPVSSRDADGHFCGQDAETGEMVTSPPDKCGYCGPECEHCFGHEVYAVQDGVWVCAADYEYEER